MLHPLFRPGFSLWPSLPKTHRQERTRRRLAWEGLEERVLLAADLVPDGGDFSLTPSSEPYKYDLHFDFAVKNNGTTAANLTQVLHNDSDNVRVRAVFSNDGVFGNGDDLPLGTVVFINGADDSTISPAPGATTTIFMGGTVSTFPTNRYLLWMVDSTSALIESNEANNIAKPQVVRLTLNRTKFEPVSSMPAGTTQTLDPGAFIIAADEIDYSNSVLRVTSVQGKKGDQFKIAAGNSNGVPVVQKGKNLKLGDKVVGTVEGGKHSQPLVVRFQQSDNLLINEVLSHVTLKTKRSQPGERSIDATVTLKDGQNLSSSGPHTIHVM